MPFGAVFGAVVFGILGPWLGLRLQGSAHPALRVSGWCLLAMGLALAVGLLLRRPWARWTGLVGAVWLALAAVGELNRTVGPLSIAALLAAGLVFLLLLIPATGRFVGDAIAAGAGRVWTGRALAIVAALAIVGLTAANVAPQAVGRPHAAAPSLSAAPGRAGAETAWSDFKPGLDKARAEKKLALVDFYATWCGPCKQMERVTFHDPRVLARLADVVPVRVDSEEETPRHGVTGLDLAEKYEIEVYPTLMLLDADGRIVARTHGFFGPKAFLEWLDGALQQAGRTAGSPSA